MTEKIIAILDLIVSPHFKKLLLLYYLQLKKNTPLMLKKNVLVGNAAG